MERRKHWEKVYRERSPETVGWYQALPAISLRLIEKTGLKKTDPIIDVGGGASVLVNHLFDGGFENLTVLDISSTAPLILAPGLLGIGGIGGTVAGSRVVAADVVPQSHVA